jgi:3-hydroxyacyl-CoA dehydrogenase/enoyl-CoA hydratase/3-hydroxybutyryl-CoA epimerase
MAFFQTDNLWVNQLADGVAALVLDVKDRPVNVLARAVMAELEQALDRIAAEPSFRLLLIRSAKADFLAGADLHAFAAVQTAEEAASLSAAGQRLFDKLANLRLPTVAVITGACLGGGLEFALACDYRVVVDHPKTQLGLPEVELGLLPGWGGTQRLPRVVGLEKSLQMILSARRLNAAEAVRYGLADELADAAHEEPPSFLDHAEKRPKTSPPRHSWRQTLLEGNGLGRWLIFRGSERLLRRKLPDDMPAPWEALQAVRIGLRQGMEAGLAYEREAAGRLATSPACRNLVNLFLQREQARKVPAEAKSDQPPVRRVGVVGAGVMGAGIAQLAAFKNCEVVVREINDLALGMGMLQIVALFKKAVERGLLSPRDYEKKLANVHGTKEWKGFADLDVVVEAATEDLQVKRRIFREMEKNTSPSTILATNTSSLQVRLLQEDLQYPGRVAGLHFFNPVHKMPLVEVVQAPGTKDEVVASLEQWATALGKVPVRVQDSPGFLVNRILTPYLDEAVLLVSQGLRPELVDEAMRRFGMPMGPLLLLDEIGLDVAAHVATSLEPLFGDRFPPEPALAQMQANGWLGRKSGVGFYRYKGRRPTVNQAAVALLEGSTSQRLDIAAPADLMAQARERMVLLMVNEAAACLGERLVKDAATLDLAMVLGTSWAPHRGGPLRYAQQRGLKEVVAALEDLTRRLGPRFRPCAELRRLAEKGTLV